MHSTTNKHKPSAYFIRLLLIIKIFQMESNPKDPFDHLTAKSLSCKRMNEQIQNTFSSQFSSLLFFSIFSFSSFFYYFLNVFHHNFYVFLFYIFTPGLIKINFKLHISLHLSLYLTLSFSLSISLSSTSIFCLKFHLFFYVIHNC